MKLWYYKNRRNDAVDWMGTSYSKKIGRSYVIRYKRHVQPV
ncbi:hypothetical protein N8252_03450 [Ulvibacter sp.]|nr:hypothetical protein [Ulvibacter sp.]